ncbi:hypothetical protein BDV96DRAFT_653528 [Lophiotrema nucula]|uniref:Cupin type-1 domain-containing protein n=1 Tax=Lophiotrema nucula TaxID=690887 RepID=A0A6A5YM14_9PLEO|nr:hypothetical protein BDV96DRAFT_653528 [Lophiotrema nucula]
MSTSFIRPKLSIPTTLANIKNTFAPVMVALINNDTELRMVKIKGEFIWHSHPNTDELWYILEGGPLTIRYKAPANTDKGEEEGDGKEGSEGKEEAVVLEKGDVFIVPEGVQHCPFSTEEVSCLVVERTGTLNTGDRGVGERTAVIQDVRN